MDGWAEGEGKDGFSSLVKQIKKGKNALSFASPDFLFLKFSVMKCLRSKKREKSPVSSSCTCIRMYVRMHMYTYARMYAH